MKRKSIRHPAAVPNLDVSRDEATPDTPFEEGVHDILNPDLRHRMVSEAAYYLYAQRGYRHGHDIDDWMEAEAKVDHLNLRR